MNTLEKPETTTATSANPNWQARKVPIDTRKSVHTTISTVGHHHAGSLSQAVFDISSPFKIPPGGFLTLQVKVVCAVPIPTKKKAKIRQTGTPSPLGVQIPQLSGAAFIKHDEHLAYLKRVSEGDRRLISP